MVKYLDSTGLAHLWSRITAKISTELTAASSKTVSTTLTASGWTGTGPYTQVLSVAGLGAAQNGDVAPADNITDAQWEAAVAARIRKSGQAAGNITLKALGDKPPVNSPCTVTIVR